MCKSGAIATKVGSIDPQLCVSVWRRRYPHKTALNVAERYGAPVRTVENWLSFQSTPSFHWVGVMFEVEDPSFFAAVMAHPPAYLVEAAREQQIRRERESIDAAHAALARLGVAA